MSITSAASFRLRNWKLADEEYQYQTDDQHNDHLAERLVLVELLAPVLDAVSGR